MLNLYDILAAEVRDTKEGPRAHILLYDVTGKERGTVKGIQTPRGKVDAKHTTVLTENVARTLAHVLRNIQDTASLAERIEACITRKRTLQEALGPVESTVKTAPAAPVASPFRALAAAPAASKARPKVIATNAPALRQPASPTPRTV